MRGCCYYREVVIVGCYREVDREVVIVRLLS